MIYEIRTYRIAPRSLAEVEKRFGEGVRVPQEYSELFAFWHTEIGPSTRSSTCGRTRISASVSASAARRRRTRSGTPASRSSSARCAPRSSCRSSSCPRSGAASSVDLRAALLHAQSRACCPRWRRPGGALPERTKLSPLVLAGGVEFGRANGFVHIWAYTGLDQRAQVRGRSVQAGHLATAGRRRPLINAGEQGSPARRVSPLQ